MQEKVGVSEVKIKFETLVIECIVDALMYVYLHSDDFEKWLQESFSNRGDPNE